MFIPDGQKLKNPLTFAEMSAEQKDKFSMRRKALEALSKDLSRIIVPVFMLGEPYEQEIKRVSFDKLQNRKAIKFAYLLECLEKSNKPSKIFEATVYSSIKRTKNIFYTRFVNQEKSNSLGLILTDPDRNNINLYDNGEPVIWQMGPERRQVSLAQRADFFELNQNTEIYGILDKIEKDIRNFPRRSCRRSRVIERFLGILNDGMVVNSVALKELGYKKISTGKIVSRTSIAKTGLFNVIGKYPRSIFGVGSMPPVSGWRDVITTAAIAHSLVFATRNSIFAGNLDQQIALINDAKKSLRKIGLTNKELNLAERNIGAAIGFGDVTNEMRNVDKLYKNAGIRLFRIYGINSDKRVIEIAKSLRQKYQDEIEIFFGQVADKKQCLKMISDDIHVDGLIFGHGGGRTCTSAANGMAITTLEEIYDVASDRRFKDTSILVEGGGWGHQLVQS